MSFVVIQPAAFDGIFYVPGILIWNPRLGLFLGCLQGTPSYNSGFRSSVQQNDHLGEERHEVWYQESMFSALASYDFPLQSL